MKDVKPSVDHPPEKIIKLEGESRGRKSDSKPQSKSQIKLTLKSQQPYKANKTVLDKLADDIDAEDDSNSFKDSPPPDPDDLDGNSNSNGDGKDSASPRESRNAKIRRDELLKQLRAVEDAIAKKRSKLPN
jgi:nuclear protein NHN1